MSHGYGWSFSVPGIKDKQRGQLTPDDVISYPPLAGMLARVSGIQFAAMGKASNVDATLSCMRKAYLSCVSWAQADAYVHGLIFHGVLVM